MRGGSYSCAPEASFLGLGWLHLLELCSAHVALQWLLEEHACSAGHECLKLLALLLLEHQSRSAGAGAGARRNSSDQI